ncbi:hypothetical protein GCM10027168_23970 [Streptomyces capparidis]
MRKPTTSPAIVLAAVTALLCVGADLRDEPRDDSGPAAKVPPTHRVTVSPHTVPRGATTTLYYTVTRTDHPGDSNARLGVIAPGSELASPHGLCVNPLAGPYPSPERHRHLLDCSFTDLQPGNPVTVPVRVTMGEDCAPVRAQLGSWYSTGDNTYGGRMVKAPAVTCEPPPER